MAETETVGKCECGAEVTRPVGTGIFRFVNDLPFVCEACVEIDEQREQAEREQALERSRALAAANRRKRTGIPPHLTDFDFANVEQPELLGPAFDAAREWAAQANPGLFLSGPVGVGKTRLGIAAANGLSRRTEVRWYSAPVLISRLGTGSFDSPERARALAALTGSAALVLDDIDKVRPSEYAAEAIFVAVDTRADGAAPLLVTSNLDPMALTDRWPEPYGEAIASRLLLLRHVRIVGADRRAGRPARR